MNPENCSSPWATDEILTYGTIERCNLPIPVYVILLSLLTLNRFKIAIYHVFLWRKREISLRKIQAASGRRRSQLPVVPTLSVFAAVSQALFLVLTATNAISSRDGSSIFLFSFLFLSMMSITQLYAFKLVRLGRRLAPLTQLGMSNNSEETSAALSNFDMFQKALIWIWTIASVIVVIAPFFVYFYPPLPNVDAVRVVISAHAVLNATDVILQAHQIGRVIAVVKQQSQKTTALVSADSHAVKQVSNVISRLQKLRALCCLLSIIYCAILTATLVTLNYFWWMYVLNILMEQLYLEAFAGPLKNKEPKAAVESTTVISSRQT